MLILSKGRKRCVDSLKYYSSLLLIPKNLIVLLPVQLLEELERRVDSDDFVAKIDEERHRFVSLPSDLAQGSEVLQAEWWEPVSSPTSGGLVPEVTGDYVLVNHEDMINAVAVFLAAYISSLPEGKSLESKQLQRAVQQALREIRKGRVRKLWDWGRWVYRAAALSYGAFAAYTNPWVAEAVFKALFTFARFARTFW